MAVRRHRRPAEVAEWQTRRSQKPLGRKAHVGSTPTFGTKFESKTHENMDTFRTGSRPGAHPLPTLYRLCGDVRARPALLTCDPTAIHRTCWFQPKPNG